jgi:Asp-tRNA(Asn)/Glu-tRNA(Gln) amidotransferase A subunit family amidase
MPALAAIARAARSVLFGCRTDRAHAAGRSPATAWSSSAPRTSFAWEAMFASCARSEPSFVTSCVTISLTATDLPIGLQFVGARGADAKVLAAARDFERASQ